MMSLRTLARSTPRTLCRVSSAAARKANGSSLVNKTSPFAASSLGQASRPAAFSTSPLRRSQASEVNEDLANKLDQELGYETEVKRNEPEPAVVKDFLENGPWKLQDTDGQEKAVMVRTFGNEKITATFTIADLANEFESPEADIYNEDPAMGDEQNGKQRSEELAEEDDLDESDEVAPPCRLTVLIEKPDSTKGALNIETTLTMDQVIVDNVYYFPNAELAKEQSAESAHKASAVYPGPPFGTLDEELQVVMERYLEERGITVELAAFVPQYLDIKEQREYMNWLKNVKDFVKA